MQWKTIAAVSLCSAYILGCNAPPPASQISVPADPPRTLVAATPPPSLGLTPTEIRPPTHVVEPLAQAERLRFDSWSPDSRWIAFWQAESEELSAHLAFIDLHSNEVCQHIDLTSGFWDGRTLWQDAHHVSVILNQDQDQSVFNGFPCRKFEPIEDGSLPEQIGEVSPNGRFRADTESRSDEQILHNVTSIIDITMGATIAEISWEASVHSLRSGPRWLNDELYLIGQTLDRGLLYVAMPDGRAGNLFTDIFKMDTALGENLWHVFSHADPATGAYHILLQWDGGLLRLPLLLYHSERSQVEELAFYRASPFEATGYAPLDFFSPEGAWLLVSEPVDTEASLDAGSGDYWLLAVDPPGSEAVKIAEGLGPGPTSWETQKIAFFDRESIYVRGLPGGDWLGRWVTDNWSLTPIAWSPNGERLVATGLPRDGSEEAIFVIEP